MRFLFFAISCFFIVDPIFGKGKIILIDPGHGGKDSGTISPHGIKEKDLTLIIAKELKKNLEKNKDFKAYLTRTKDQNLSLPERVRFCQKIEPHVFISLHVDYNEDVGIRGVGIYTLGNFAQDKLSLNLAKKENYIFGMEENQSLIDLIVTDLTEQDAQKSSKKLAKNIFSNLNIEHRGSFTYIRSGEFKVLKQNLAPRILIELGNFAHPKDHETLTSPSKRKKIIESLTRGIISFLKIKKTDPQQA